jgi:hypothetical protein
MTSAAALSRTQSPAPGVIAMVVTRLRRANVAVLAWVVHVVLIHLAAALTVALSPGRDSLRPDLGGPARYLIAPLSIWDGGWYLRIAEHGYASTRSPAAFFPLYPALIDLVSSVTTLSPATVGVLVSDLMFLGGLLALGQLAADSYGPSVATVVVWLMALHPFAFVYSAVYTESTFLLVSVGAILLARRGRWTSAALATLLATLTRSAGLLVLLPVGLALLQQVRRRERGLVRPAMQLAAAAMGPVVFAVHLRRVWGDALLMIHAQTRWGRESAAPWDSLWHGFRRLELIYITGRHQCRSADWPTCRDALRINIDALSDDFAVAAVVVALALIPVVIRRLHPGDAAYGVGMFILPLLSGIPDDPLVSLPRYLLTTYPFTIALAILLQDRPRLTVVLAAFTVALCWLVSLFARAYFVA